MAGTADEVGIDVPPEGLPLARARNAGAQRALDTGAELLVFLDVDCIPGASLVNRNEAAATVHRRCCAVRSHTAHHDPVTDRWVSVTSV